QKKSEKINPLRLRRSNSKRYRTNPYRYRNPSTRESNVSTYANRRRKTIYRANANVYWKHQITLLVMADKRVVIRKGEPIARLVTLPGLLKQPDKVLAGQKVETKPAPFKQNLTPEQKAAVSKI